MHECRLWCFLSGQFDGYTKQKVLSGEEKQRCLSFVREEDRELYATAHVGLRLALSDILGEPPGSFEFGTCPGSAGGARGKPELLGGASGVHFSLSHSHGVSLVAVAPRPIGVDVQYHDARLSTQSLWASCLGADEIRHSRSLSSGFERERLFFHLWACKEALLKADGCGLSVGMEGVQLDVAMVLSGQSSSGVRNLSGRGSLDTAHAQRVDLAQSFPDEERQLRGRGRSLRSYSAALGWLDEVDLSVAPVATASAPRGCGA